MKTYKNILNQPTKGYREVIIFRGLNFIREVRRMKNEHERNKGEMVL